MALRIIAHPRGEKSAIATCADNGLNRLAQCLLIWGYDPNEIGFGGWTALMKAISFGNDELIDTLLEANAAPDKEETKYGWTALMEAVTRGQKHTVAKLLAKDAKPNVETRLDACSALKIAVCRSELDIARVLISYGAEYDFPLEGIIAGRLGNWAKYSRKSIVNGEDVLRNLLILGVDPNQKYYYHSILVLSILLGKQNFVKTLLENGADPNTPETMGTYPLSMAISISNIEIVHILLEAGANTNLIDSFGLHCLHYAEETEHSEITELLFSYDADKQMADLYDAIPSDDSLISCDTELALLVWNDRDDLVMQSIASGADLNLEVSGGLNPLIAAIKRQNLLMVKKLLQAGADPNLKNVFGINAREVAEKSEMEGILWVLECYHD